MLPDHILYKIALCQLNKIVRCFMLPDNTLSATYKKGSDVQVSHIYT